MAGRGPQSFKKRQKEQQRKEKQQAKIEKRLQRRRENDDKVPEGDPSVVVEPHGSPIEVPVPDHVRGSDH